MMNFVFICQINQALTLVVSYLIGLALQLFWFAKIAKGALKTLRAPPAAKPSTD